ncbi:putative transcriptional regulator [Synechococcus sp. PCC 7502]|uniref:BlaI/MecI/CopY family transcriptional regulator n=1 Tax=Synechococcus sp. PCC 7502 TaxID=1173263 RepID=UPI00029FAF12|nr:BlaI/MecI/CopY family transcriptional regulator [Synechococcus sp. PCC 7502]AFY75354.1 putative transcriptional regulator [Synechococcus sp. PCC 7502]
MAPLPDHRPQKLSLGSLESEILNIIWDSGLLTARDIHDRILANPDRELTIASVMTVLNRLTKKGWVSSGKRDKLLYWQALISREEFQVLNAYNQLHSFLQVGNADIVAAFADELDLASQSRLEAIAQKLQELRQGQETN